MLEVRQIINNWMGGNKTPIMVFPYQRNFVTSGIYNTPIVGKFGEHYSSLKIVSIIPSRVVRSLTTLPLIEYDS